MRLGKDVCAQFKNLYIVHQNIPGKREGTSSYKQHLLFFPLRGELTIATDHHKYSLSPGQMLYLAPSVAHSFSSSVQGGERLIAMLAPQAMPMAKKRTSKLSVDQLVKEILFYLLFHPKTKIAKSLINVLAETLSEGLERMPHSLDVEHLEGRVTDPRIRQVLGLMRQSSDERVSLEDIAKRSGRVPVIFIDLS